MDTSDSVTLRENQPESLVNEEPMSEPTDSNTPTNEPLTTEPRTSVSSAGVETTQASIDSQRLEHEWKRQTALIGELRYFMNLAELKGRFALGKLLRAYLGSLELQNLMLYQQLLQTYDWKSSSSDGCLKEDYEFPGALTRLTTYDQKLTQTIEQLIAPNERRLVDLVFKNRFQLLQELLQNETKDHKDQRLFLCHFCGEISTVAPTEEEYNRLLPCKTCSKERLLMEVF